ncbi:hypothetical protein CSUI_002457 [Cystoisospora suis]|uniref:Uncharacterized protein n=1 Tax=Cystoisospora suis TaxID=483139 RepID=A0A2C6KI29_9APIC|nr:hypothetical protein CSUI_002457 [Cystoisospora suis]
MASIKSLARLVLLPDEKGIPLFACSCRRTCLEPLSSSPSPLLFASYSSILSHEVSFPSRPPRSRRSNPSSLSTLSSSCSSPSPSATSLASSDSLSSATVPFISFHLRSRYVSVPLSSLLKYELSGHLQSSFSSSRCIVSTSSTSLPHAPALRSRQSRASNVYGQHASGEGQQKKEMKKKKFILIELLKRPEKVNKDGQILSKMIEGVKEKREGHAAAQLMNALASSSSTCRFFSPSMFIHALSFLQQKKWLPCLSPDIIQKRNQRILLSLQTQSSTLLSPKHMPISRAAKDDSLSHPSSSLGDIQRVLIEHLNALSHTDFCLTFRLLTSSSFSPSPIEWRYLLTQLKIRIPHLDVSSLSQIALSLVQTLPSSASCKESSIGLQKRERNEQVRSEDSLKHIHHSIACSQGQRLGAEQGEGYDMRGDVAPMLFSAKSFNKNERQSIEETSGEKKMKISYSLCDGRLEREIVERILKELLPSKEVSLGRVSSSMNMDRNQSQGRSLQKGSDEDEEDLEWKKGSASASSSTVTICSTEGASVCTAPPVSLIIAACGRLVDLSIAERIELKEILKQVVAHARDHDDPEGKNGRIGKKSRTTEEETFPRKTRSRDEGDDPSRRRRGKSKATADAEEREKVGEIDEGRSDMDKARQETTTAIPKGENGESKIENASCASLDMTSASKDIDRVLGELLHVPTAMSALQSSDVFLFLDCLDGVYRHLTRFTDAQLAAFSRRVALVLFEKKTTQVDNPHNDTNELTETIDGFQLLTLFFLDRLPSMPLRKQSVFRSLLISLLRNHPSALQPSLPILSSSFLIHMHPLLIKQTDNLWSGVDPLSPRYSSFLKYSLSNTEFSSLILDISRIFHLAFSTSYTCQELIFSSSKKRTTLDSSSSPSSSCHSLSLSLQSLVTGKNFDSKLHAAWRVFSRSIHRAVQSKLHDFDTLDLARLAEAAVLLRRIGGGCSRRGGRGQSRRSPGDFYLLMRGGIGRRGIDGDEDEDREIEMKIDEEEREMLDVLAHVFRAMDQRSWSLNLEHAEHLMTVLSLLSSPYEDKRKKGTDKDVYSTRPLSPPPPRRASPQLISLLARLVHLSVTKNETLAFSSHHADGKRVGGSQEEDRRIGEASEVYIHRNPEREVLSSSSHFPHGESYPRRPPSFTEFLFHQDKHEARRKRREQEGFAQEREDEEERSMQCEDEEEGGLLNSISIKQLRVAMSIFSPRLLTTLRTAGLPDDAASLLLFSLESIVWCIQEVSDIGSMPTLSIDSLSESTVLRDSQGQPCDTSTALSSCISEKLRRAPRLIPDASKSVDAGGRGGEEQEDQDEDLRRIRNRRGEDDTEKDEEEERRRKGREQVLLTLLGISKQTLAGAFGACGLLLDEMSPKDRRRTRVVGLTSRLSRYLPSDVALHTERQLLNEDLLRALPADVDALRSQCVEVISMRAVKRQKILMERDMKRKEKKRQKQEEEKKALSSQ